MPIPLQPAKAGEHRTYVTGIGGGYATKEYYSLAFQVIASVSVLDAWRQDLFVRLLGGKDSVGAAAYLAIVTRAPKIAAIKAAAATALPADMLARFERILKASDCLEAYRDKLAHWQEYRGVGLPDGLCLRDPSAPRDPQSAPCLGLYVFPADEMRRYINYAVDVSGANMMFQRILESPPPWSASPELSDLDTKIDALSNARSRL